MPLQDFRGRIRFSSFELDLQTRELRKDGRPVKLQDQPGKLLALLACRAGELVTRTEIEKALWREGEFVEFEHAVNTAVRKIREALGDDPEKPRFIETLPRKGYRFIATVETAAAEAPSRADLESSQADRGIRDEGPRQSIPVSGDSEDNAPAAKAGSEVSNPEVVTSGTTRHYFSLPRSLARSLFLVAQGGYLAIYCAALYKAEAVERVLSRLLGGSAAIAATVVLIAAMCGIAIRLYLIASFGLDHPAAGDKFRRMFPALFLFDTFWAVSPLLLVHKIGYGLALGATAALAYLPFSQRTLVESIYGRRRSASSGLPRESN